MSNIRTIINNKAKVFGKLSEAEMKNQLKTLNYIELLSMQMKTSLTDWEVLNTFRAKEGSNKLITNPKEINKRMFVLAEKAKLGMQRDHVKDVIKHEKKIRIFANKMFAHRVSRYEQNIKELESYIVDRNARIENYKNNTGINEAERTRQIEFLNKDIKSQQDKIKSNKKALDNAKSYATGDQLVKDIAKIVTSGFWRFFGISGANLQFITANNVILFEKNPRAGLNLQKDMGTYKVKLNLEYMECTVHSFFGNTKMSDNIHPYVSQGGICFGNAGKYYQEARNECDLVKMMSMVGMVLSTYSSANGPYRRLADFRLDPNIPATKEAERYLAKRVPNEDKRLEELLQSISMKDVANKLAKSIGGKGIESVDDEEDDEDEDYP